MPNTDILSVTRLSKIFSSVGHRLAVLQNINFRLAAGASCAIVGASGSGKTTLLGLCAGLDQPTSGSIAIGGVELGKLNEDQRARLRSNSVGFVFQNFQLIPTLSALENVMVPLELRRENDALNQSAELLTRVGLADRLNHYPVQLSGGEQQRVALARAFVNRPRILFADEPTGNLDAENSGLIANLLFDLNREAGTALVLATHDLDLTRLTQRVIQLKGGRIISDRAAQG